MLGGNFSANSFKEHAAKARDGTFEDSRFNSKTLISWELLLNPISKKKVARSGLPLAVVLQKVYLVKKFCFEKRIRARGKLVSCVEYKLSKPAVIFKRYIWERESFTRAFMLGPRYLPRGSFTLYKYARK